MPFSSVLGASTLTKPGVATSSTRPASPFNGQVLYETDTAKIVSWNGSAWVYTAAAGGLVLITAQTILSAVPSVVVSDVFSSTYDNYKITVSGGVSSGAEVSLRLTLGATTANYYWSNVYMSYSSQTVSGQNGNNIAYFNSGVGTTNTLAANIELQSPNLAKRTIMLASQAGAVTSGNVETIRGYLNDATQYTAFTITPASGTLTGGVIRVYGYSNS